MLAKCVATVSVEEDGEANKVSEKEVERNARKRVHVIRRGNEREVRLLFIVEELRMIFYCFLYFILILGVVLTKIFVTVDYERIIRDTFGMVSVCVYLDFPPGTYVLPSIWSVSLFFIYLYGVISFFRAWVAFEEGKFSRCAFAIYSSCLLYVLLSFAVFSTIFAVQPEPNSTSMVVHAAPYTNFCVALFVLSVLTTWFGEQVSWSDMDLPRACIHVNRLFLVVQAVSTLAVIVEILNGLLDMQNHGAWWNVRKQSEELKRLLAVVNYAFIISVLGWPFVVTVYLRWRRHVTHCVYVTLHDNRDGKDMN